MAVVCSLALATACGSRRSYNELLAAARAQQAGSLQAGPQTTATPAGERDAGDTTAPAASDAAGVPPTAVAASPTPEADTGQLAPAGPGASAGASAPAAAQCTGREPPITIASIGWYSGLGATVAADMPKAIQAWVASVNAKNGIHCHKIKYLVADNGNDPARHQQLVAKMVEQDHVIAFLNTDATSPATGDYLTQKRVPAVGGSTGNTNAWYSSPMFFPQAPQGDAMYISAIYATGEFARAAGHKKLGSITCLEVAQCTTISQRVREYGPKAGMTVVYSGQASLTQPDFTSQCQAAQRAGAEILLPVLDPASVTRIARSCAGVNYHPQYVVISSTSAPSMASDPNFNGVGVAMPVMPWVVTENAAVAEFRRTLERYAPGVRADPASMIGWTSAKLFERATRDLAEPPTSAAVLEGLWSIKDDDLGGLTTPLTFTRMKAPSPVICWWLLDGKDGSYTSPNHGARGCL